VLSQHVLCASQVHRLPKQPTFTTMGPTTPVAPLPSIHDKVAEACLAEELEFSVDLTEDNITEDDMIWNENER
jgi:hypothetical protein